VRCISAPNKSTRHDDEENSIMRRFLKALLFPGWTEPSGPGPPR
jgi:hypothetical protein